MCSPMPGSISAGPPATDGPQRSSGPICSKWPQSAVSYATTRPELPVDGSSRMPRRKPSRSIASTSSASRPSARRRATHSAAGAVANAASSTASAAGAVASSGPPRSGA